MITIWPIWRTQWGPKESLIGLKTERISLMMSNWNTTFHSLFWAAPLFNSLKPSIIRRKISKLGILKDEMEVTQSRSILRRSQLTTHLQRYRIAISRNWSTTQLQRTSWFVPTTSHSLEKASHKDRTGVAQSLLLRSQTQFSKFKLWSVDNRNFKTIWRMCSKSFSYCKASMLSKISRIW